MVLINKTVLAYGETSSVFTSENLALTFGGLRLEAEPPEATGPGCPQGAMTVVLPWLLEPLQHDFMVRALLVSTLVSCVCGLLSCFMTLKGWALMGDAVSHAVMPGVVIAYALNLPFALGAFVFGVGSVAAIGYIKQMTRIKEDTVIGLVFTGFFALGLTLISKVRSTIDLSHILFGNVLGISSGDILQTVRDQPAGARCAAGAPPGSHPVLLRSHPRPFHRHPHRRAALPAALGAVPGGGGRPADRGDHPGGGHAGHPRRHRLPAHRSLRSHGLDRDPLGGALQPRRHLLELLDGCLHGGLHRAVADPAVPDRIPVRPSPRPAGSAAPFPPGHPVPFGVTASADQQRWPWWPLLPLYPYGRRRTLVRELIAERLWSFEQLQGVWYVAVPIRMTVLRVREGLLLYAPVAPTAEVRAQLRQLEERHGPVCTIVLPTASGLEHKLPVPAMARAFPTAAGLGDAEAVEFSPVAAARLARLPPLPHPGAAERRGAPW